MLKSPAFSTSFLESRMIQKLKSRKSRIKSGFFAFLLAERIIFGKKTQKSRGSLLRCLTFSLVCGRIWQRGAPAGSPAVRVVGRWSPVATVQRRPRRQPRQVLLPLPKSRRKHWVFAGFLFACGAWEWGSFWFKLWLFAPSFTRSQLFPSPPAPKTHPVSPFLAQTGCVFLFFAVFWLQNFCPGFCALCCIAFTN